MNKHLRYVLKGISCGLLAVSLLFPAVAGAAGYLKIEGIKGESTAQGHGGEMAIESWSWGESPAGGGMPSGKRQHKPIFITKTMDKTSPILREASSSGQVFQSVTLSAPPADGSSEAYLTYKLTNAMVSGYMVTGSDVRPMESFSLSYQKIDQPSVQDAVKASKQK